MVEWQTPLLRLFMMTDIAPIEEIVEEIRKGNMVILVDEEDRENEGDLVFAAEFATPEKINFMARHGRGLICLTLTEAHCKKLNLPLMVQENGLSLATNFTVSIEAATGVTTGISAADRARTVLAAVDSNAKPSDIVQPGHIFPLRAQNGGVLVRAGHTEAGCDLARMAGLTPASVICEILKDDGEMARLPDLIEYAKLHGLKIGTIADLIEYRSRHEKLVERVASRRVQTVHGEFDLMVYVDKTTQRTHLALARGEISQDQETLVRVHEPLSVMDFLETGSQGHSTSALEALQKISEARAGVLVLLHRGETPKELLSRATLDAGAQQHWDTRSYGIGAQILRDPNVGKMRLLSSPHKMPSMAGFGLEVVGYANQEQGIGL